MKESKPKAIADLPGQMFFDFYEPEREERVDFKLSEKSKNYFTDEAIEFLQNKINNPSEAAQLHAEKENEFANASKKELNYKCAEVSQDNLYTINYIFNNGFGSDK